MVIFLLVVVMLVFAAVLATRGARYFGWKLSPIEDLRDVAGEWVTARLPRPRAPHRVLGQVRRQASRLHMRATDNKTFSPGEIVVLLHPDELAALQTLGDAAPQAIASASMKRARAKDWVPRERIPEVALLGDPEVPAGRPQVTGRAWVPGAPRRTPAPLGRVGERQTRVQDLSRYVHDGHTQLAEQTPEPTVEIIAETALDATVTQESGPWLSIVVGAGQPTLWPPFSELTIGRSKTSDVVVAGEEVSRKHVTVTWHATGATVTDGGSSNGTWIDGRRVAGPEVVGAGSSVTLGRSGPRVHIAHVRPRPAQ